MKKLFLSVFLLSLTFISALAQKIEKPILIPAEPTALQKQLINDGAKLHDQQKYDEAIANYNKVLQENPTCVMAMYEKTLSLYYKKDFKQTLDLAYEGTKYKSNELPLFYGLIANVYDDQGNSQKAVELYNQGIGALEGTEEFKPYLASLYFNLGVTKFRQKKIGEAKETLKKSVLSNFAYPSPNYLLATIYKGTGYRIPALLAAARLISLEFNTERTKNSVAIFKDVIGSASSKSSDGKITVFMNPDAPKDEGDFSSIDLLLGTLTAVKIDGNKDELDTFADSIDIIIGLLAKDEKLSATFVGKTYIPFMAEMKMKGYVKPFACLVLQQDGNEKANLWLNNNKTQAIEFINWSRNYK